MKTTRFNRHRAPVFKHFSNKPWSLFSALGKEVLIGVLSVATLTHAKADGIATKPLLENADTTTVGQRELDMVVVTGSRAPLTAAQSAKMVEVISRDDIHRAEAQSVNDVLKLATGVDVRQRGGFGVQTDISINGGTFDQISILLNGMPLSSPQTGHNAADFPVSLSDIDHIEVLEGASARVFGASAFSGAINIVTRPESLHHGADSSAWSGRAAIEAGSFGTVGGDASIAWQPAASLWQQLSGGYTRSDGGTANSKFRKGRAFYQGAFYADAVSLNWQAGFTTQDFGANTFYSARFPIQFEWTRRLIGSVSAAIRPFHRSESRTLRSMELTPTLYGHRDLDHYQLTHGKTGAEAGENYHRTDVYGASLNLHFDWLLGKTAVGADLRKEHIRSTAYGRELPEDEWQSIHGSDRKYSRLGNRTNTSLFLEHDVILGPLTVSGGILAIRNTGLDGDFRFYPGVDVSYRPTDHWKLYASWNRALRLPTFTDLYTLNAAQQGDLNLKPEKNSTAKIGARYRATGFEAVVSGFYSHGTNMIDWVYETEQSTRYHAMNIGKLNNMGFNLETTFNLTTLFCPSWRDNGAEAASDGTPTARYREPVRLKLGYAFIHQHHETRQPIFRSLYALEYLRHKFVAELSHPIVSHLSAAWTLRWQQRMNGYHPYAKLDGRLTWTEPHWSLYLKADNLTCHRYYDLGDVRQPGLWLMAGASVKF